MSLGECPDCDKTISLKATICPHCGCPFADEVELAKQPSMSWITKLMLGLAVGYGIASYSVGRPATFEDIKLLTSIEPPTCDNILPQIYSMSEEQKLQNNGLYILRITPQDTILETPDSVSCMGLAKWSNTAETRVEYKLYTSDGEVWIEFQQVLF